MACVLKVCQAMQRRQSRGLCSIQHCTVDTRHAGAPHVSASGRWVYARTWAAARTRGEGSQAARSAQRRRPRRRRARLLRPAALEPAQARPLSGRWQTSPSSPPPPPQRRSQLARGGPRLPPEETHWAHAARRRRRARRPHCRLGCCRVRGSGAWPFHESSRWPSANRKRDGLH
jgi:hypothetical protein